MFSERLLDHFRNPRNVGELSAPAIAVEASNPACGDVLKLWARFEDDRIAETAFKVRGCTASIATASALTELLLGRSRSELAAISTRDIENAVDGLPAESKHAAALCRDALKLLLTRQQ